MTHKKLKKILVVDDEPDICKVLKIALEDIAHFEIFCCCSGEEALIKSVSFKPDLILLDMMLPGMDGIAIFEKLKNDKMLHKIPVIFITAKIDTDSLQVLRKNGVLDVIIKPFNPLTLEQKLLDAWEKR